VRRRNCGDSSGPADLAATCSPASDACEHAITCGVCGVSVTGSEPARLVTCLGCAKALPRDMA
jgi:hypothetical protein